jgi:hypothetical protein
VSRSLRIGPGVRLSLDLLGIQPGTDRAKKIARAINTLAADENLPGSSDTSAILAPVGRAWVRRIDNFWLWYQFNDDWLRVLTIRNVPPIPDGRDD